MALEDQGAAADHLQLPSRPGLQLADGGRGLTGEDGFSLVDFVGGGYLAKRYLRWVTLGESITRAFSSSTRSRSSRSNNLTPPPSSTGAR
jgi:hypothetical protein